MSQTYFPPPAHVRNYLFEDAQRRDLVTARRALLVEFLWRERYLTREGLFRRVKAILGRDCFGASDWWPDVFSRDMRIVKAAFRAASYELAYSRRPQQPGYFLKGQPAVSDEIASVLRSCIAEVDPAQIRIFKQMSPAQRFKLGISVSDAARSAVLTRHQSTIRKTPIMNPEGAAD